MSSKKRSHFSPFLEGPGPWLALFRNALPLVGFIWFSWAAAEIFLQIWFDGVTALGAMLAFQVRVFASRDKELMKGLPAWMARMPRWTLASVLWACFLLLLGIPYWFAMLIFGSYQGGPGATLGLAVAIYPALLPVLASNVIEAWKHGYSRMTNEAIRLEFDWHFHRHMARVCVMILAAIFVRAGFVMLAFFMMGLSYVEIYPMRTLRFLGGDASLDRANKDRSRD